MIKLQENGNLFEGPVWDEQKEILYWVDILEHILYRMIWKTKEVSKFTMGEAVGCLVLDRDGNPIVAAKDGLYLVDINKQQCKKLMNSQLPKGRRYNDGKCDPYGNLWIGSMAEDSSSDDKINAGKLYCIKNNKIIIEYAPYTIPNGLAWSKNVMYHAESHAKKIFRYQQEQTMLGCLNYDYINLKEEVGVPDGMCMDEDGNLWIAMWGGYEILCLNPESKQILHRIAVPDKNVSCVTFGGPNRNLLFVTTARDEEGNGGALYYIELLQKGKAGYRYGA